MAWLLVVALAADPNAAAERVFRAKALCFDDWVEERYARVGEALAWADLRGPTWHRRSWTRFAVRSVFDGAPVAVDDFAAWSEWD